MRVLLVGVAVLLLAATASAQPARVSGRVIDDSRGAPIAGASVRLTGADPVVTDSAGRFQFDPSIPGRLILSVSSIGYQFRSIDLVVAADTTVVIRMTRRITALDTMIVRPRYLRIRGTAVDSATGDHLMQAQAILYPGAKFVGAMTGKFTFDSVPPGPVTIVVEGFEHLPTRIEFDATRDTSFTVRLAVDSVALRMIALQVARIAKRSQSLPMTVRGYNRAVIAEQPTMTIGDFLDRKMFGGPKKSQRDTMSASGHCYFVDDMKVDPGMIDGMIPELVERVEIYKNGAMVRVYTKRYIASLMAKGALPKVIYMTGTRLACH